MSNYDKYIVDTTEFQANKLNLFEAKTNIRVVLDNLSETIFKDVLNYVFKYKFNFNDFDKVIIKTEKNIKKISDLEFNDIDFNFTTINYLLDNSNDK
jgi:hypothetical protein